MGSPQEPQGSGNGSKSTKLVLLAAGVGAVLILAAVLTFTVVGSGPTELSTSKYAKQLCNDVLRPGHREINKIIRSTAFKNLDDYESRWNKSRTNDTINGVRELIVTARDITQQIGKFSDGYVLRGRDGEEFRADMAEGVTSAIEDFDDAIADIGELRSEDEEDAIEDLIDIFDNVNGIPIDISDGSPAADIMSALERGRDECYSLMHDLIDY